MWTGGAPSLSQAIPLPIPHIARTSAVSHHPRTCSHLFGPPASSPVSRYGGPAGPEWALPAEPRLEGGRGQDSATRAA